MAHIESLIEAASIIKRGPNYFLELKVDADKKVFINEWVPLPQQKLPEKQYKHTGVFRTHFGEFLPEDIKNLKGCLLNCEARPHKANAGEYFFTTAVVFEPVGVVKDTPTDPVKSEEKAVETIAAVEKVEEKPVESPKEESAKEEPPQTPAIDPPKIDSGESAKIDSVVESTPIEPVVDTTPKEPESTPEEKVSHKKGKGGKKKSTKSKSK